MWSSAFKAFGNTKHKYIQSCWSFPVSLMPSPGCGIPAPPHHEMSLVTDLRQDHLQSLLGVRHRPRHPCSFAFQARFPAENHLFPQNGNFPRKQPRSAKLILSALPFEPPTNAHFVFVVGKTRSQPSIPAATLATMAKPRPPLGLPRLPPQNRPDGFEAVWALP